MTLPELGFVHRFVPGTRSDAAPLLLLHGTGGDEDDLLALGAALAPGAALLSPRGQVLEHGMPRFFRRHAEGVLDQEDLRFRAGQLADFLAAAREEYSLRLPPVAVGYSNGANIAAALMLLYPGTLGAALLFRPMVPLVPDPLPVLDATPVLVAAGIVDQVIPRSQTEALVELLRKVGADVTLYWSNAAHGLTREDLQAGERWMETLTAAR